MLYKNNTETPIGVVFTETQLKAQKVTPCKQIVWGSQSKALTDFENAYKNKTRR